MNMSVLTKTYTEPPFSFKEILRYAGCTGPAEELMPLLTECIDMARPILSYRVCFCELPVYVNNGVCDFDVLSFYSQNLAKNLSGCEKAVLFAATVGAPLDRLITRYSRLSPSKALMLQALGAERIEALCDSFCDDISKQYSLSVKPRFSPGYGDLPLSVQSDIFAVLNCSKHIGLTLNNSLLMSPTKSVSAFVGIGGNI